MTEIERQIAGWFGGKTPLTAPMITMPEEYIGIAGHLLLSAGAGAAYALVWRRDRSVIVNGLVFGAAFFIAAHAIVGPLLGLTPGMWNFAPSVFATGCVINGFFGLCTAFFAHQFDPGGADRQFAGRPPRYPLNEIVQRPRYGVLLCRRRRNHWKKDCGTSRTASRSIR